MDTNVHRRYLDYRELFAYFGRKKTILTAEEFEKADAEHRALLARGRGRNAADDARLRELAGVLFRD